MADAIAGELTIAEDVITDLAGYAALESYGIVGMAAPTLSDGIAKLLPASRLRRGINVERTDDAIDLDLYVIIAQLPVRNVNVHVQGVKVRD